MAYEPKRIPNGPMNPEMAFMIPQLANMSQIGSYKPHLAQKGA